jgi:uncharacterized protein YjiS (DUF1127 family)
MPGNDIDLLILDYRSLTPHQKEAFRKLVIRRAEVARGEVVRNAFRSLWSGFRGLAAGVWSAYLARRRMRIAAAELNSLDDRTLRDLGISRSEIGAIVRNGAWRHEPPAPPPEPKPEPAPMARAA